MGINSVKEQISTLENIVSTDLPQYFDDVISVFANISSQPFSVTTFMVDVATFFGQSLANVLTFMGDSDMAIKVFNPANDKFSVITPLNVLQQAALNEQTVGVKKNGTFTA